MTNFIDTNELHGQKFKMGNFKESFKGDVHTEIQG